MGSLTWHGHVRATAAWRIAIALCFAGQSATAAEEHTSDTTYNLETVVQCGGGGDCQRYLRGGWAKPDRSFTWTNRTSAKLKFSLPPLKGPLGLRMRVMGNLQPPDLPVQVVEVLANGRKVALWLVDAAEDFYAIIPADVVRADGKLNVELKLPRAQRLPDSPAGQSARFGIACYEIELAKAASAPSHLAVTPRLQLPVE